MVSFRSVMYQIPSARSPLKGNKLFWVILILGIWIIFIYSYDPLSDPIPMKSRRGRATYDTPIEVKIMIWNLQGYSYNETTNNPEKRLKTAIEVLAKERPDAIMLQELTLFGSKLICEGLKSDYQCILGHRLLGILYLKSRFNGENYKSSSDKGIRTMEVKLNLVDHNETRLVLMNMHLTPYRQFFEIRKTELIQCFETANNFSENYNVVIGGDTNLEEDENADKEYPNYKDAWKECGSSEKIKYTWDATQNPNEKLERQPTGQKPQVRYDRIYFRSSKSEMLKLSNLKLGGKEKVEGTDLLVSDHFALIATFKLSKNDDDKSSCIPY